MLSIVIIANKVVDNLYERNLFINKLLQQYQMDYNVSYICCDDYAEKDNIANLVSNSPNHSLLVMSNDSNTTTLIYSGIAKNDGNDVLLLTVDANQTLITEMIEKINDGYETIYVKQKQNWFADIVTSIGIFTYHIGQSILGQSHDMCNDSNNMLIDAQNVDTITHDAELSKVLRITNQAQDKKYTTQKINPIYDNPTPSEKKPFNHLLSLGIVSIAFYITLIFMACIFPLFNDGTYNLWVIISIVLWLGLGALGSVFIAKKFSKLRMGQGVPISLNNKPILELIDYIKFGDYVEVQQTNEQNEKEASQQTDATETEQNKSETSKKSRGRPKKEVKTQSTTKTKQNSKATTSEKSKRGRPKKETSKTDNNKHSKKDTTTPPQRGRPKGSLNKKAKTPQKESKGQRGRPKGSKNKK